LTGSPFLKKILKSKTFVFKYEVEWKNLGEVQFEGNSEINGLNHTLTLIGKTKITVAKDATLRLSNITIEIEKDATIKLLDDSSKLLLENVVWEVTSDYHFTKGSFEVVHGTFHIIHKPFLIVVDGIVPQLFSPSTRFYYQSKQKSIIHNRSTLKLSNIKFVYDPSNKQPNLFILEDEYSLLWLESSILMHLVNMIFDRGKIKLSQNVCLSNGETASKLTWQNMCIFADKNGCRLFSGTKLERKNSKICIDKDGHLWEFKCHPTLSSAHSNEKNTQKQRRLKKRNQKK